MTVANGENWIGKLSNEELRKILGKNSELDFIDNIIFSNFECFS